MSETTTLPDLIRFHERELEWYTNRLVTKYATQQRAIARHAEFHRGALVYLRWLAEGQVTKPLDNNVTMRYSNEEEK